MRKALTRQDNVCALVASFLWFEFSANPRVFSAARSAWWLLCCRFETLHSHCLDSAGGSSSCSDPFCAVATNLGSTWAITSPAHIFNCACKTDAWQENVVIPAFYFYLSIPRFPFHLRWFPCWFIDCSTRTGLTKEHKLKVCSRENILTINLLDWDYTCDSHKSA